MGAKEKKAMKEKLKKVSPQLVSSQQKESADFLVC